MQRHSDRDPATHYYSDQLFYQQQFEQIGIEVTIKPKRMKEYRA
jgi:hypothetical protein